MSTLNTRKRRNGIGPGKFMGASSSGVVRRVRAVRDARQEGPAVAERRAGNWSIGHEAAEEKAAGNGAAHEYD
ncbi:hypothetical protein ACFX13_002851 [Malus domestica]